LKKIKPKRKQNRSKIAIDNIVSSAHFLATKIINGGVTVRDIAIHSGHSIGSIYHHFKKIDDIFIHIIFYKMSSTLDSIAEEFNSFDHNIHVNDFIEWVLNYSFNIWGNPKNRPFLKYLRTHPDIAAKIYVSNHVLVGPIQAVILRNTTNSFIKLSDEELRLRLSAYQRLIIDPFIHEDPIAGSEAHKNLARKALKAMATTEAQISSTI